MAEEKKKSGRKDKYVTHVEPFFKKIDELLQNGASEKQVAEEYLNISYAAWNVYKQKHDEFRKLCEKPRTKVVYDLRSALIKVALGMKVKRIKKYKKVDEDGNIADYTEVTEDELPPNVAALNLALKNYDKDNWANDPQNLRIKEMELEIKRQRAEMEDF